MHNLGLMGRERLLDAVTVGLMVFHSYPRERRFEIPRVRRLD